MDMNMEYFSEQALDINSETEELLKLIQNASSQDLSTSDNREDDAYHLNNVPDLSPIDLGFNFDVTMKGDSNSWLFHANLQKIFIKMNSAMTINISYNQGPGLFYLRAMILFDNPNEMHLPVKRCANHSIMSSNNIIGDNKHILKCLQPYATYSGTEEGILFRDRLSVVVPIENARRDEDGNIEITYEFACQNSCTSGINRKSTSVVFTLENEKFKVLGKKAVQFKVCSCPKRDAERESREKRKSTGHEDFPKGKRPKYAPSQNSSQNVEIKTEPHELDVSTSPNALLPKPVTKTITMPDAESMNFMLECGFNKITGKMAIDKKTPPEYYSKYAKAIRKQMENQAE